MRQSLAAVQRAGHSSFAARGYGDRVYAQDDDWRLDLLCNRVAGVDVSRNDQGTGCAGVCGRFYGAAGQRGVSGCAAGEAWVCDGQPVDGAGGDAVDSSEQYSAVACGSDGYCEAAGDGTDVGRTRNRWGTEVMGISGAGSDTCGGSERLAGCAGGYAVPCFFAACSVCAGLCSRVAVAAAVAGRASSERCGGSDLCTVAGGAGTARRLQWPGRAGGRAAWLSVRAWAGGCAFAGACLDADSAPVGS